MRRRKLYIYGAARYLWLFRLTPMGRVLVLAILLTALGSVTTQLPIYQVFCGLLGLLGVSELVGLILKPSFQITGQPPARSTAGGTATTEVTLTNRSRWRPALDAMISLYGISSEIRHLNGDATLPWIGPGQSAALPITLQTNRRGIYPLPPVRAVSTFPFNLIRYGGGRNDGGRLVVLPSFHSLEELDIPISHRYQPRGAPLVQGFGASLEFIGTREYVPGDPARHIDSKAWGRTGKPVVKEFHDEYVNRIALVLDTHLPVGRFGRQLHTRRLEAGVSLMAAIAERLNFHEHVIDLFAAGPEMYVFRSLGGTTHFENVLEILAGVDACRSNPFDQISPLLVEELETISTVVCVFVDWDAKRQEFARRVQEAGCMLKAVLIVDEAEPEARPAAVVAVGDWTEVRAAEVEDGRIQRL